MKGHLRLVPAERARPDDRADELLEELEQARWHLERAAGLGRRAKMPVALFVTMARELFIEARFK